MVAAAAGWGASVFLAASFSPQAARARTEARADTATAAVKRGSIMPCSTPTACAPRVRRSWRCSLRLRLMFSDQSAHQFHVDHRRRLAKDQDPLLDQVAFLIRHSVICRLLGA